MICKKCNTNNITKAKYCNNCGNAFTDEERKAAYNATVYGKVDMVIAGWKKFKSVTNLSIITGNKYVKYGTLVVIIVYGLLAGRAHGNNMTILDSNEYDVQYNESAQEYYVISNNDNVTLDLYLPQKANNIYLEEYWSNGNYCDDRMYSPEDAIEIR